MGMSLSIKIAYGVDLGGDETSWGFEETDDYDLDFTLPWEIERSDDKEHEDGDRNTDSSLIFRFLLKRLPENPYGEEIDGIYSWDLEEILKERTGLRLLSYGYSYGCTLLASGSVATQYDAGPMDLTAKTLEVTPDQERWLAWAMDTLGVTFKDKPGVKAVALYG